MGRKKTQSYDRPMEVKLEDWAAEAVEILAPRLGMPQSVFARMLIYEALAFKYGVVSPIPMPKSNGHLLAET